MEAFWRMLWHHQGSGSISNPRVALLAKYSRATYASMHHQTFPEYSEHS